MTVVADALLPIFLIIALGVLLKHTLLRARESWFAMEELTYFVLFPALLVVTTATADLRGVPAGRMTAILVVAVFVMTSLLLGLRPLITRGLSISGASFTSIFQSTTRWNTYVALAIAGALYGASGLALMAVAIIATVPLLNVMNVWVLAHFAADERLDMRATLGHMLRNPLIWSCAIGLALNLSGLPLPKFVIVFGEILGRASLALGLLLVGVGLNISEILTPNAAVFLATFLKLGVMPLLATGLAYAFGISDAPFVIIAIATSVPAAPGTYILARQMGGDAPLAARILAFQTLIAFATISLVLALVS